MLSTTMIAKKYNFTVRPYFFDFLKNHGFIIKNSKFYELTEKGKKFGGSYKYNEKNERWIVWNENKFIDVIKIFKLRILEMNNIATIDHMIHIKNLDTILKYGLFAHNNPYKKIDISNKEVNNRRNAIEPIYEKSIHEYVPFYFNPRNAMLYRNQKEFGEDIIILGFSNEKVIFTNANAAADDTLFTNDITELFNEEFIDFSEIFSRSWNNFGNPDYKLKQSMMAEILVYNHVEIKYIKYIYCQNDDITNYVKNNYNVGNIIVKTLPKLFFKRLI